MDWARKVASVTSGLKLSESRGALLALADVTMRVTEPKLKGRWVSVSLCGGEPAAKQEHAHTVR